MREVNKKVKLSREVLERRNDRLEKQLKKLRLEQHEMAMMCNEYSQIRKSLTYKFLTLHRNLTDTLVVKPFRLFRNIPTAFKVLRNEGWTALWKHTKSYLHGQNLYVRRSLSKSRQYKIFLKQHTLTKKDISILSKLAEKMKYQPKISIITPVYNVSPEWLNKCVESVLKQVYTNWELCIHDDASTKKETVSCLKAWEAKDKRIKISYGKKNQHISGASNSALKLATGDFIALLDNDDELAPEALYEVVKLLNEHPEADFIYSDEDKLDEKGQRVDPYFKSDWNPDLFLSNMYTCHLGVYRKSLLDEIGGFRKGFDSSQDYDLVLRLTEKTDKIFHIPKVLYHWRKVAGSTSSDISSKKAVKDTSLLALREALDRRNIKGEVLPGFFAGSYRAKRTLLHKPLVSIIIPFRDEVEVLQTCLESLEQTEYRKYEILLINNQSTKPKTKQYLSMLRGKKYRILNYNRPFNFSAINNYAVKKAKGEVIVFMNSDIEIINPDWLSAMLEHAQRPEVGAVGAKLLYPDGRVQHAGIILGLGTYRGRSSGVAGHAHKFFPGNDGGYFYKLSVVQNVSAVTAALLMVRKEIFEAIGGFNEDLRVAFNDVDFCLKLRAAGYLNIYTPYAEAYHHESLSRGAEDSKDKQKRFHSECEFMYKKWGELLARDPYYNPNLTLEKEDFSITIP